MARPVRAYRYVFHNQAVPEPLTFDTQGETPCIARRRAFELLEAALKVSPDRPSKGWFLHSQTMTSSFGR